MKIQANNFNEHVRVFKDTKATRDNLNVKVSSMELELKLNFISIVEPRKDSGWVSTSTEQQKRRGLHDYKRTVVTGKLNELQKEVLRSYLENVNNPGWTGTTLIKTKEDEFTQTWEATTTWDSSD
jgi:hypothetical protein